MATDAYGPSQAFTQTGFPMSQLFKKSLTAAALGSLVSLAACGGGGGSDEPSGEPVGGTTITGKAVAGPLDPVQQQLSGAVLTPLAGAMAGTPLQGVVLCGDELVNQDVLDLADSMLVALQTTAADPRAINPAAMTGALNSLAVDLTQLLQALAGQASTCASGSVSLDQVQALLTQLNGTPLAPLSTQFAPALNQLATVLAAGSGGMPGGADLQLSTVAVLVSQLNTALQQALAQIPADAYEAPVVGSTLATVATALDDLDATLTAALTYQGPATGAALQTLIDHLLVNVTTRIVPLATLEEQAGQPGVVSNPIIAASGQLAALVGSTVGQVLTPTFGTLLDGALAPVLDPIENQVLPAILGPLVSGLASGGTDPTGALAGTPLAPAVNAVTQVLGSLLGLFGSGSGSGSGAGAECAFANIPLLSILCGPT